jgi:hypothetical protein
MTFRFSESEIDPVQDSASHIGHLQKVTFGGGTEKKILGADFGVNLAST